MLGDLRTLPTIDLKAALALAPELVVARLNQARLLERRAAPPGRGARARRGSARPPAGHRAAIPTAWARARCSSGAWVGAGCCGSSADALAPALPAFFREACAELSEAARAERRGGVPDERRRARCAARPCCVAALVLAPLLLLLDAAVSIDAPVFVAVARQIIAAPADPFGFQMIWDPTSPDTAVFNRNPPLLSYWLAPWIALFGERETVMHAALLPFPVIAALAFLGCARRLAGRGLEPALLLVATPAFGVLASTLMLDVPLLAFWLLAIYALAARGRAPRAPAGCSRRARPPPPRVSPSTWASRRRRCSPRGSCCCCRRRAAGLLQRARAPAARLGGLGRLHVLALRIRALPRLDRRRSCTAASSPREFWNQLASVPIYYGAALVFPVLRAAGSFAARRTRRRAGAARPAARHGGGRLRAAGGRAVAARAARGRRRRARRLRLRGRLLAVVALPRARPPGRLGAGSLPDALARGPAGLLELPQLARERGGRAAGRAARAAAAVPRHRSASLAARRRRSGSRSRCRSPGCSRWRTRSRRTSIARRRAASRARSARSRARAGSSATGAFSTISSARASSRWCRRCTDARTSPWATGWRRRATSRSSTSRTTCSASRSSRPGPGTSRPGCRCASTNADAGAGFYSHHAGYLPFAFSTLPLDRVQLGRVVRVRGDP